MPSYNLSGAAKVLDATDKALSRIRGHLAGKIPATDRDTYLAIDKRIAAARSVIDAAIRQAAEIENDARIYPDGKIKMIRQVIDDAGTKLGDHVNAALTLGDVLKATLTMAALPKMSESRYAAQIARQDALMILDRTPANRRQEALMRLAGRNDDVGALVTSGWLDDYLFAVGDTRTTEAMRTIVQDTALRAARDSGDPDRAKAAEAIQHIGQFAAASTGVQAAWRHVAEELSGTRNAARLAAVDAARRAAEDRELDADPVDTFTAAMTPDAAA